jgi:hypothetical protein
VGRLYSTEGGAYQVLLENSEGKRPLERPRLTREDNIKIDLKKQDTKVWTGFIWLKIGTSGRLL